MGKQKGKSKAEAVAKEEVVQTVENTVASVVEAAQSQTKKKAMVVTAEMIFDKLCKDELKIIKAEREAEQDKDSKKKSQKDKKPTKIKETLEPWKKDASVEEMESLFSLMTDALKNGLGESDEDIARYNTAKTIMLDYFHVIRDKYIENVDILIKYVGKMGRILDFSSTPMLSFEPNAPLYGAVKDKKNGISVMELDKAYIVKIIDALISNNFIEVAGKWIYEILFFDPSKVVGTSNDRRDLIVEIKKNLKTIEKYQNALAHYMINGEDEVLFNMVELATESKRAAGRLELQVNELKRQSERDKLDIESLRREKTTLQQRIQQLEQVSVEMGFVKQENSRLRRDNEHHIANYVVLSEAYERKAEKFKQDEQEYKDKLFVLEEEVKKLQETIEKLIIEKTSLESDLDSAKKDVRVLSSDDSAKRGQIGQDAVEDLWSGIKDKIDQFIKYFSYFTETYADDDTAEFAMDDMYEFLDKLERYGIKVIGKIGEQTGYDVSIHHLEGDKLPSGSPVRVVNTGWMVFGKVVSKAEVEKVEN